MASRGSGKAYIGYVDDTPEIIFGVGQSNTIGVGHPWLLATDGINKVPFSFTRNTLRYVAEFQEVFPILTNIVDARNELHLQWLERMGFTFIKEWTNMGPGRIVAKQFILVRK